MSQKVVCIRRQSWAGKPMTAAPSFGELLTIRSVHISDNGDDYYRFEDFRSYNIFSTGNQSTDENQFHFRNFRPIDLRDADQCAEPATRA
jgi:hypothetical protein